MEADAHVAVQPPQSFDAQQVLSVSGGHVSALTCPVAQGANVVDGLSPAADDSEGSNAAEQKDPIEEELHAG